MRPGLLQIVAAALLAVLPPAAGAQNETLDITQARRRAEQLLLDGKRAEARPILEQIAAIDPGDHVTLYNLACVRLSAGEREGAEEALRRAIGVGFVDFHQMLRDPDLAPLRDSPTVRTVTRDWARVLDVRGETDVKAAKEALGPRYIHVADDALRVHILSAFGEEATKAAHAELRRVAKFVERDLFDLRAPAGRPDPWTLVILPTREHFRTFVPFDGVGGVYDHDRRRLVTRDLGPSLRHEFVHVLHHRRMMRTGQRHAFWLQEGVASLAERLDGSGRPVANWRINIARRLAEPRRLTPWERFLSLDGTTFVTVRPLAMYAQAYGAALWLHETKRLRTWFEAYERTFDESPGGEAAFRAVFGESAGAPERALRDWLVSKDFVPERFEDGAMSLGVDLEEGGEAPVVAGVFARRPAGSAGSAGETLRLRDVLRSVNGTPVRTVAEVIEALEGRRPGERVEVEVRRGRRDLAFEVEVVPFDEAASRGMADRLLRP